MRRPAGSKSSKNTDDDVSAPAGLCAPSTMTSGWCPITSKRPGMTTSAKPSLTSSPGTGAAKNASTAVSATTALSPWWRPCSGTNTLGVHRGGRAQIDHAAAERELVLEHVEVVAAQQVRGPTGVDEELHQVGIGLADHHGTARLDDAGLLGGDVGLGGPGVLGVVDADVGDHRHLGVAHVGGVPATEQPDLDDGHVDGDVGEPAERSRGDRLEVGGPHAR